MLPESFCFFLGIIHANIDCIDMCMCLQLRVRFSHVIWCDIGPVVHGYQEIESTNQRDLNKTDAIC